MAALGAEGGDVVAHVGPVCEVAPAVRERGGGAQQRGVALSGDVNDSDVRRNTRDLLPAPPAGAGDLHVHGVALAARVGEVEEVLLEHLGLSGVDAERRGRRKKRRGDEQHNVGQRGRRGRAREPLRRSFGPPQALRGRSGAPGRARC